jgi:hypothetical protein
MDEPKRIGPATLLLAFLAIVSAYVLLSQIWLSGWDHDEPSHIAAGLDHLETGRMASYRVNPPLYRLIAAIPLLIDRPDITWHEYHGVGRPEQNGGYQLLHQAPDVVRRQLRLSRLFMVPFFLLGAWVAYRWAGELYGNHASIVATAMWCLSPEILTRSSVVGPDLPAASTGLLSSYAFWRWMRNGANVTPWWVGFATALALLCKFTWLILLVAFPIALLFHDCVSSRGAAEGGKLFKVPRFALRRLSRLLTSFLLTLLLINVCYGFEGTFTQLGKFEFKSQILAGEMSRAGSKNNRVKDTVLGKVPMPVPREMLQGIDFLRWELDVGAISYLRGQWQHRGWWYYYLYAMAVKISLGYWFLILAGLVSFFIVKLPKTVPPRAEWFPLLIALLFLVTVSSQTGFTHHLRYVLPVFGFLFVIASRSCLLLPTWVSVPVVCLALIPVTFYQVVNPGQSHSYFNLAAGGPNNGWRHLSFDNVDPGQSAYRMLGWERANRDKRPLTIVFSAPYDSETERIEGVANQVEWKTTKDGRRIPASAGWYLISAFQLTWESHAYFQQKQPFDQPFPDMLVFHVTEDEIAESSPPAN